MSTKKIYRTKIKVFTDSHGQRKFVPMVKLAWYKPWMYLKVPVEVIDRIHNHCMFHFDRVQLVKHQVIGTNYNSLDDAEKAILSYYESAKRANVLPNEFTLKVKPVKNVLGRACLDTVSDQDNHRLLKLKQEIADKKKLQEEKGQSYTLTKKGLEITFAGDISVGIFSQNWTLQGEFDFLSESDSHRFLSFLKEAFEYVCGERVGVKTLEEVEKREKMFEEVHSKHNPDEDIAAGEETLESQFDNSQEEKRKSSD
mgnify:CR=1 FL=1